MTTTRQHPRAFWSAADRELLRRHYADSSTADLARVLGRSVQAVGMQAIKLGLRKSEAWRAAHATTFQPGLVPWNKGVRYEAGGRSAQTRFKPGGLPHGDRH